MTTPEDDTKAYITLKRKITNVSNEPHKQAVVPRTSANFETNDMVSPHKKRLYVTVDPEGNQMQVEVAHNALPENVSHDDSNSYIVNADDINLDLSSYSYSVVVDGIVEDVDLNDCQYTEEPVKGVLKNELDESESGDDHDEVTKDSAFGFPEPEDADPLFKSMYRMSRLVASVSKVQKTKF